MDWIPAIHRPPSTPHPNKHASHVVSHLAIFVSDVYLTRSDGANSSDAADDDDNTNAMRRVPAAL